MYGAQKDGTYITQHPNTVIVDAAGDTVFQEALAACIKDSQLIRATGVVDLAAHEISSRYYDLRADPQIVPVKYAVKYYALGAAGPRFEPITVDNLDCANPAARRMATDLMHGRHVLAAIDVLDLDPRATVGDILESMTGFTKFVSLFEFGFAVNLARRRALAPAEKRRDHAACTGDVCEFARKCRGVLGALQPQVDVGRFYLNECRACRKN